MLIFSCFLLLLPPLFLVELELEWLQLTLLGDFMKGGLICISAFISLFDSFGNTWDVDNGFLVGLFWVLLRRGDRVRARLKFLGVDGVLGRLPPSPAVNSSLGISRCRKPFFLYPCTLVFILRELVMNAALPHLWHVFLTILYCPSFVSRHIRTSEWLRQLPLTSKRAPV